MVPYTKYKILSIYKILYCKKNCVLIHINNVSDMIWYEIIWTILFYKSLEIISMKILNNVNVIYKYTNQYEKISDFVLTKFQNCSVLLVILVDTIIICMFLHCLDKWVRPAPNSHYWLKSAKTRLQSLWLDYSEYCQIYLWFHIEDFNRFWGKLGRNLCCVINLTTTFCSCILL